MQDRVCLRRRRTINPAGRALALHRLTVSLMGCSLPRKSLSPPVLFSGIEAIHSSTHGPITITTPSRVPSYVSIINIASSCHYSATIDFPRDAISSTTRPCREIGTVRCAGVYRARPVGMLAPGKQYRLYINIFGGLFSLSISITSRCDARFRPTSSDWSATLELCTSRPFIIHPGDSKFCSDIAMVTTGATRSIVGTTVCPRPREAAAWAPRTSLVVASGAIPNSSSLTCSHPSDVDAERDWGRFVFVAAQFM